MATKLSRVSGFGSLAALAAAVCCVLMLGGCPNTEQGGKPAGAGGGGGGEKPAPAAERRTIVATTAQIGDIVRNLTAGVPGVEVKVLLGEGVDPHTYKLTRSDAAVLHGGDLVFFSGLHLEGKMGEVITELGAAGKRVVEVGAQLPRQQLLMPEGSAGQPDPHFWMDPELFTFATGVVSGEVFRLVSGNTEQTEKVTGNAREFNAKLRELDETIKAQMAAIPEGSRTLITSHDAFGYFGRRYGLSVHAVQGISTESEAGIADVQRLVDLIVSKKVPAVFVESSVSDRTLKAVIEQAAGRGHTVRIGGQLYSDAMGKPGTAEGTYIGMLRHNAKVIAEGLTPAGAAGAPAGKSEQPAGKNGPPAGKPGAWMLPRPVELPVLQPSVMAEAVA